MNGLEDGARANLGVDGIHAPVANMRSRVPRNLLKAATRLLSDARGHGAKIGLAIAGGPRQQVLRPAMLEDPKQQAKLKERALLGDLAVLDVEEGTSARLDEDQLRLEQESSLVTLTQAGDVAVVVPAIRQAGGHFLPALIEEEVVETLEKGLRFMSAVLADVDPVRRLTRVAPLAALLNADYVGWKTREEHRRSPNTTQISMRDTRRVVSFEPPGVTRARFDNAAGELAEDLMVLLRRASKA
jgi:hypothetical protein